MKFLKRYWNLWGGVLIGIFIAWVKHFSKESMDLISSAIVMTITLIGALTFLKSSFNSNKNKQKKEVEDPFEKATTLSQVKHINMALNPSQVGIEFIRTIDETLTIMKEGKQMNKFKKFFKWLWGNKCTLINIIVSVCAIGLINFMALADYMMRYAIFARNEMFFKIAIPILSTLWLALDIFTTVSKYGCESLKDLDIRIQEAKERKLNALTPEQKKAVKSAIIELKGQLAGYEPKYNECLKTIESFNMLSKIPNFDTSSLQQGYQNALNYTTANANLIAQLKSQISLLEEKL